MSTRDANDTTWYVLRYREDFTPRVASLPEDPSPPRLEPTLLFDEANGALELVPGSSADEATPPPGVAVDVNGSVYLARAPGGPLVVRRCDGSEVRLPCEPHVLAQPVGLALDRRGLLYVADRAAGRVVVLSPDDGSVRAVLAGGGLEEPVDVAVAPGGRIYVADRQGGAIHVYRSSFQRVGRFVPRSPAGLPIAPRPIAVMIDADGALLVADAHHPRLLRCSRAGAPLGEVTLTGAAAAVAANGEVALDALERAYGRRLPRARAGVCGTCAPADDLGKRLAEVHRTLRVLALRLAHSFPERGVFVSAALDGGRPGTAWHKLELEADLPAGTWITIETATAEAREGFDPATATWAAPPGPTGAPVPFDPQRLDQLVQSPPGRFLWVRVTLAGGGEATPSLRALRVYYPRHSYLDELPRVYRRDPAMASFLEHYLALFERVLTGVEDRWELFSRELNPDAAPREVIDWLACLVDLAFDPSWPLDRRRALVAAAMELYRTRGTVRGLEKYVEIYTGTRPVVTEDFLHRPAAPSFLGHSGNLLGGMLRLGAPSATATPDDVLRRARAHRFTVLVFVDDDCDAQTILPVVDRIITVNKPAHAVHTLRAVEPGARVGQLELGIDFVVGAPEPPRLHLAGCPAPGAPAAPAAPRRPGMVLGQGSILGERRPEYQGPFTRGL